MQIYIPRSKWTWSFFIAILCQAIIGLSLGGIIFAKFQDALQGDAANPNAANQGTQTRAIPIYLSLLIFAFIYELLLVYDAFSSQNTIQVIGIVIMNLGLIIYTGIQISQVREAYVILLKDRFIDPTFWSRVGPSVIALPCVIAFMTAVLAFLAYKLYGEFGWNIYKQIGADRRLRDRFFIYQIYITLLKFDFFLFLGFEIQFLILVVNTSTFERWTTIAAIPTTILLLVFAAYATKHENMIGVICTLIIYLLMVIYFISKLVRMYHSHRIVDYLFARTSLTVFAIITLLVISVTIFIAVWCALNFGKGLKPHLNKQPSLKDSSLEKLNYEMDSTYQNSTNRFDPPGQRTFIPARMEID